MRCKNIISMLRYKLINYATICLLVHMIVIQFRVCLLNEQICSLDLSLALPDYYTQNCVDDDWNGFLSKSCCGSTFRVYLHALGQRANRTGLIYLNSDEQWSCLSELRNAKAEILSCGIDKLTSGGGGCSDFSVANVTHKFTRMMKSLEENCQFEDHDDVDSDNQLCHSCVNSWQNIRENHSVSVISRDDNICRFAALVSLTSSRIDDKSYVQKVYSCLSRTDNSTGLSETPRKRKPKIITGILIILGCLVGAAVVLIIIATIFVAKRRSKSRIPQETNAFQDLQLKESDCPKFSLREVYLATNNLNIQNFIGEGTAGVVYKGLLSNNQHVAVKHIFNDGNAETVVREVGSLSHVRHPNLVSLLGCCVGEHECFLVYELCPNGNLSQWIFGKDKILSWKQRLQIAIESARGLCFLHTYSEGYIVHRDIKPTNILLGENFEVKLSDFGLSKVINQGETDASSEVRGTFGYVDPEYQNDRLVNSSGDVYSFGIVLLQILSGKKVINMNMKKPMTLEKMAKSLTKGGSIIEFADPKLGTEYSAEAFVLVFKLALSCTSLKQQRPSMEQVVTKLEEALTVSTKSQDSFTTDTTSGRPSITEIEKSLNS